MTCLAGTRDAHNEGMKRILPMALIALTLSGGVALADRGRGRWHDTSNRQGGTIVTPTRGYDRGRHDDHRWDNRRWDNRRYDNHRHVVVRARPTFRNDRFYFSGGHYQSYQRPVIQYRYRNYYQRPAVIVENIQPVGGYIWSPGQWEWDGYEWQWIPGHYDVDPNYQDDDSSYQDSYYQDSYEQPYINGGVQVQGSWNF